jgi:TolA-binding protein
LRPVFTHKFFFSLLKLNIFHDLCAFQAVSSALLAMATGDKKQIYIFDIDSALDHLENELNEENTVTIQSQYQKTEISKQKDQEIKSTELKEEENGNISTSVSNNNHELISANEHVTSISIDNNKEKEKEGDEREYLKFIDSRKEKNIVRSVQSANKQQENFITTHLFSFYDIAFQNYRKFNYQCKRAAKKFPHPFLKVRLRRERTI